MAKGPILLGGEGAGARTGVRSSAISGDGLAVWMGRALAASLAGLAWDFCGHEIAGISADLESIYAPPTC